MAVIFDMRPVGGRRRRATLLVSRFSLERETRNDPCRPSNGCSCLKKLGIRPNPHAPMGLEQASLPEAVKAPAERVGLFGPHDHVVQEFNFQGLGRFAQLTGHLDVST